MIGEPPNQILNVPLGLLRRYLTTHGWRLRSDKKSVHIESSSIAARLLKGRTSPTAAEVEVYVSDLNDNLGIELVLPTSINSTEYDYLTDRVLSALCEIEEKSRSEILKDIREIAFDVLRSRIPDGQVVNDTIHLERARGFIVGIRSVLAAAATTEISPSPYFLRLRKEATSYANNCRFGHTFRGSFGFTVESPLTQVDQIALPGVVPIPPFERRVMRRLATGLNAISDAARADSILPVVDSFSTGINANVCEQIINLMEDTSPSGLILDFSFSPELVELGREGSEQFFLGHQQIEILRASAKELRSRSQSSEETVFGRVTRLASDADPSDMADLLGEREVVVLWSSEQLGDISVRVALNPPDYLLAVEAHAAGRPVGMSGTLERRGNRWVLLNPSDTTF